MSIFYFNVRDGKGGLPDDQGVDLPAAAEAKAHGLEVVREIMKWDELRKRHWRLEIIHENGAIVAAVPFATVDPSLDHLPPYRRRFIERLSEIRREIGETMHRSKSLAMDLDARREPARGRPYLITRNGRRV